MLQGLSQPFNSLWFTKKLQPGLLIPRTTADIGGTLAKASPVLLPPSAADESTAAASCRAAQPSRGYLHPHLPETWMEGCGPESRSRDAKGAGRKGSVILQQQVREKGKIKPPAAPFHPWPCLALASHLSGAGEGCGVRCRDCSPADTWRDQDPVLSKVMKCEPFPSVIFNALNPATVLLRLW